MTEDKCSICYENYTASKRKTIKCKNCEEVCCLECFKNYLLKSDNITPKCMFCSENISYSFIREECSINFCNKDLHNKRKKIEVKRQITLMPATQYLANLEIERRKYFQEIKLYDERIEELRREISIIQRQKNGVPWPMLEDVKKEENKITFIQKCPVESCNGFLNSAWKCGICETFICNRCHSPKASRNDPDHICDEDIVSNIRTIKKDSKPCPKCSTYIFKIDGCDQMWCPECKTAFSWRTGRIEKGTVHNPHYFEFMRTTNNGEIPRQPGDGLECDMIPGFNTMWYSTIRWRRNNPKDRDITNKVMEFLRQRIHFNRIEINKVSTDYHEIYSSYRVRYLLKDITLEDFESKISKSMRKEERDSEILEIYNLYYNVTGEILKNLNELLTNNSPYLDITKEIDSSKRVKNFCNEKLKILSKQFKNNIRLIKN